METVIIKVNTKKESKFFKEIAEKMGYETAIVSEQKRRNDAKKELVSLLKNHAKFDISDAFILQQVKEVRSTLHGK